MPTTAAHTKSYKSFQILLRVIAIVHLMRLAAEASCPIGSFSCIDGNCIHDTWKCDGEPDCPDGEDEDPHICDIASCSARLFTCVSGQCVAETWRCDGEDDCNDGSDEINCDQPVEPVCDVNSFRCEDGTCISDRWQCDGENDCVDSSDEANCNPCESYGFHCHSGECTSMDFVCDGVGDCKDASDELNCVLKTTARRTTRKATLSPMQTQYVSTQTRDASTDNVSTPSKGTLSTPTSSASSPFTSPVVELSTRSTTQPTVKITPYRLEGRVAGIVNSIPLEEIKMSCHGTDHEKSYVSFHPVPESLMTSLYPLLIEITSLMGWMLAAKEEISGFAFTEGKCTRRAHLLYETGDNVTILQKFQGKTGHSIAVHTFIEGTSPVTDPVHHQRIVLDNDDRYTQLYPGMLHSSSSRHFQIGRMEIKYTLKQHISFDALLADIPMDSRGELTMNMSDVTITYDNITSIARLGMTTHIAMLAEKQSLTTSQPSNPGQRKSDIYIYIAIAGSMTISFIIVISVICVLKRRRKKANQGTPNTFPSSQAENRAYMEMGSAALYEEIPSRAFDSDYVLPEDVTCHRDEDTAFCNGRVMNEYSDIDYEVPKTNSNELHDHKQGLNNINDNEHMKEHGAFTNRKSTDKYYLSPCYLDTNCGACVVEEDGYMEPANLTKYK